MKTDGIFQNWDEVNSYVNSKGEKIQPNAQPGDVRFVDANGDGKIDDADRVKIGKGMPDWTVGFSIALDWRGFDLNAFFQGTIGNDVFDGSRRIDLKSINLPSYMLDRWHGEGTSNSQPLLNSKHSINNLNSEYYIEDGSFFRIRNVQLAYNFDKTLISRIGMQALKLYVNIQNLKTWKHNTGYTPELGGTAIAFGVDDGSYPMPAIYTFGFNLTF